MASQDDIAKHIGISQGSVSKFVKQGVFPAAKRGEFDLDQCRVAYVRYMRGQIALRGAKRIGVLRLLNDNPATCPVCNREVCDL